MLEHNVTHFLDAPCGAMEWQKALLHHIQETQPINFVGVDIVSSVIENNKESFSNEKTWKFIWGDVSSMRIEDKYDLIMSRDVFFHLTFDKIMCAIKTFLIQKVNILLQLQIQAHRIIMRAIPGM